MILALAAARLIILEPERKMRLSANWLKSAGIFSAIALIVTILALSQQSISLTQAIFGAKIDLELFVAAALASLVADRQFARRLVAVTIVGGVIVGGFVVLQAYLLPPDFLTTFGYNQDTIKPYLYLNGYSETKRYGGTLGGPNQLGAYLIIPLMLTVAAYITRRKWLSLFSPVILSAMYYSYSRSAWIGAATGLALLGITLVPRDRQKIVGLGFITASLALVGIIAGAISTQPALQEQIFHATSENHTLAGSSDSERLRSISRGWNTVIMEPLGHGLGAAGPATFQAASSNIIENQFLQIAYETGWLGLFCWLLSGFWLIQKLYANRQMQPWSRAAGTALIGISIAGLFIPTWDDSSTALIAFVLAGSLAESANV